jgi:hypothetical protein
MYPETAVSPIAVYREINLDSEDQYPHSPGESRSKHRVHHQASDRPVPSR